MQRLNNGQPFSQRQRFIGRLIFINALLLLGCFFWLTQQQNNIQLAVAKGGHTFYAYTLPETAVDATWVRNVVLTELSTQLDGKEIDFVNAVPLPATDGLRWAEDGCADGRCIQATLYNYTDGGSVEIIINLDNAEVVAHWSDEYARPGGSTIITPKVLNIAAANAEVRQLLGDVHNLEQAMVPMSAWLVDDDCRDEWCVDLTFHDPAGSGRIIHVFVNMEQEKVARIFYTRGRKDIEANAIPPIQRYAYTDGCQEQYGWEVCWEMTANDGVNFYDAAYKGDPIFSSAKMPQVEAWYPSWPGGYRDEIGFRSSVPPFGDTDITDLGDGFEVKQLFTEFTHWPNCVCCYRYEQIIRFYEDGSFEPRFVSHGPGCDDLSIYRGFWRIDMALENENRNNVWVWEKDSWVQAEEEFELYPFTDDVAPDGTKLGIAGDELLYTWQMEATDPLGLDEARVFVLQGKEGEGDGPTQPGPGDTFIPPRQWLDGDSLQDENIVIWFVSLLKSKKVEPYWCMPDPEPGINQCEAILRIVPVEELYQPTEEELLILQATPTPSPTPLPGVTPTLTPTPQPTATPRTIQGDNVEDLLLNSGCGSCHSVGFLGEPRKVGPDLSNIGLIASERVPGQSAEEYLREAIVDPDAYIVSDCPNGPCLANVMPPNYGQQFTDEQIEDIVAYLMAQDGTAVPTHQPVPASKALPAAKTTARTSINNAPLITAQILLVTLVFLLTLFRLLKDNPNE